MTANLLTSKAVHLIVVFNSFEQNVIEHFYADNLDDAVKMAFKFGIDVKRTRFYKDCIDVEHDITAHDCDGVKRLLATTGKVYAVVYPADPMTLAIASLVIGIGVAVAMVAMMPDIPTAESVSQPPSPNNAFSQRTNRQRLGGRRCDNYGRRLWVPDLIAKPYSFYVNHDETEFAYMSLGYGHFDIHQIFDGKTDVSTINGTTVKVFEPGKSPVTDAPQLQIGNNFTADEQNYAHMYVTRYDVVNGQVLAPPDNYLIAQLSINGAGEITGSDIDFTGQFVVGDNVTIQKADKLESGNNLTSGTPAAAVTYNLNGTYQVKAVSADKLTLDNPSAVNADFATLAANADFTKIAELNLSTASQTLWQGPFYTDQSELNFNIVLNVIAPNSLYINAKDGGSWAPTSVDFEVIVETLRVNAVINSTLSTHTLSNRTGDKYAGSWGRNYTKDDEVRRTSAMTYFIPVSRERLTDVIRFSIRRKTPTIKADGRSVVQEIRIKDFFTARYATDAELRYDETTIYVKQRATEGAMALKERKINIDATRKVRNWQNYDALIPSLRADDIIYDIVTCPHICGLTPNHIDMPQIKAEIDKLIAYFGTPKCAEFCYSFDVSGMLGQDYIAIVATAVFCQAYRTNNKIRLLFECPTLLPSIWFNAHNILPNTYEHGGSFGSAKDYDGVKIDYIDPIDDAKVSYHYPSDQSAKKPHEMEVKGVLNKVQAHMHAMRVFAKDKYACETIKFTGADESNIVIPFMRIGVTNIARANVQAGSVMGIDVINNQVVLTLSNNVTFADGVQHTIFVQLVNGMTDNIICHAHTGSNKVVLDRLPLDDISTSYSSVVRATYELVAKNKLDYSSYIVTSKTPADGINNAIEAVTYDERFYANDKDFINGLIS